MASLMITYAKKKNPQKEGNFNHYGQKGKYSVVDDA